MNLPLINKSNNPFPMHETTESAGFDIAVNLTSLEDLIEVNKKAKINFDIQTLVDDKDLANGFKITLRPNQQLLFTTGLWLNNQELEDFENHLRENNWISPYHKMELKLYPKSSAGIKEVTLGNLVGLCDKDFKEEIKLLLKNTGNDDYTINHGDKLAQGCSETVLRFPDMIKDVERTSGFGSTN